MTALTIIESNADFVVINKPPGVSAHNELGNDVNSLLSDLLKIPAAQIHLVQRLDQETSGLMVVSINSDSVANLKEQLEYGVSDSPIEKKYYVLTRGKLKRKDPTAKNIICTEPISNKAEGRKNPLGKTGDRVKAKTDFKVLSENNYFSLVQASLFSGRTHQIRKHLAFLNAPIVGDNRYNDAIYNSKMAGIYSTDRMFLQSYSLKFMWKNKTHTFEIPLDEDFKRLVSL